MAIESTRNVKISFAPCSHLWWSSLEYKEWNAEGGRTQVFMKNNFGRRMEHKTAQQIHEHFFWTTVFWLKELEGLSMGDAVEFWLILLCKSWSLFFLISACKFKWNFWSEIKLCYTVSWHNCQSNPINKKKCLSWLITEQCLRRGVSKQYHALQSRRNRRAFKKLNIVFYFFFSIIRNLLALSSIIIIAARHKSVFEN